MLKKIDYNESGIIKYILEYMDDYQYIEYQSYIAAKNNDFSRVEFLIEVEKELYNRRKDKDSEDNALYYITKISIIGKEIVEVYPFVALDYYKYIVKYMYQMLTFIPNITIEFSALVIDNIANIDIDEAIEVLKIFEDNFNTEILKEIVLKIDDDRVYAKLHEIINGIE